MPKRKREDGADGASEGSPEPVVDAKQRRLQLKLEQGTVKLGHAFKVAKGFERQKLGRRQKTAASQKNDKDTQRIEAEIIALKVHYAATEKNYKIKLTAGCGHRHSIRLLQRDTTFTNASSKSRLSRARRD